MKWMRRRAALLSCIDALLARRLKAGCTDDCAANATGLRGESSQRTVFAFLNVNFFPGSFYGYSRGLSPLFYIASASQPRRMTKAKKCCRTKQKHFQWVERSTLQTQTGQMRIYASGRRFSSGYRAGCNCPRSWAEPSRPPKS